LPSKIVDQNLSSVNENAQSTNVLTLIDTKSLLIFTRATLCYSAVLAIIVNT